MIIQHIIDCIDTAFTFLPGAGTAILVGALIALCASLLGVPLVLKRFSFIGDGLSHVAFGAYAIALVMSMENDMILILPVTIIVAVLLLKGGQHSKIRGDASLALISVSAMGVGYLILNAFKTGKATDVCNTLFGSNSLLTMNTTEIILSLVMACVVILLFVLFYRQIFAVTFDEAFATATGVNAEVYNLLIAVITAIVIVIAMNLVGSLLISSLIIFPALSSMRLFKNFRSVIISAAVISVSAAVLGVLASFVSLPATGGSIQIGPAIVAVNLLVFLTFTAVAFFKRGDKKRKQSGLIVLAIVAALLLGAIGFDVYNGIKGTDENTDTPAGTVQVNPSNGDEAETDTENEPEEWVPPYEIDCMLFSDTVSPLTSYSTSMSILDNPANYADKTIQVDGNLKTPGIEYDYYCIEVTDETGCCIAPLPIELTPEAGTYPEDNAYVVITGIIKVADDGSFCIQIDNLVNLDSLYE
ncbi:MAG: metal ABC transporter permease [Clostridia bacterium]|nr:metal ABC transporter permease [Clostridia bacterium]